MQEHVKVWKKEKKKNMKKSTSRNAKVEMSEAEESEGESESERGHRGEVDAEGWRDRSMSQEVWSGDESDESGGSGSDSGGY